MTRREFALNIVGLATVQAFVARALAAGALSARVAPEAERWLRDVCRLCAELKANAITAAKWEAGIDRLYAGLPLPELMHFLDFARLTRGIEYPDNMAATREVPLPALPGLPDNPPFGHRIFALERGTAVVPHAHNNMVSAHLVVRGSFHVRTFERVRDEHGVLFLRPSLDRTFRAGDLLTMSDAHDNVHWLVGLDRHSFTFDTPVTDIVPGKVYPTPANSWSMIYVDPTPRPDRDGFIPAPVIDFEQAIARFGRA